MFTGDPTRFGFPEPDHKIYESHPIVNTLVLHHLGHGDIHVRKDVERLDGSGVRFVDGSRSDYDLIVLATGYTLHYPFVDRALLDWSGMAPDLYLNVFSRRDPNLFVLGMIEASGIGWQGRYEQAELVASVIRARELAPDRAAAFEGRVHGPRPDLSGGYHYLGLERMAYYVNKDAYRSAVRARDRAPGGAPVTPLLTDLVVPLATDVDDITIVFNESSLTVAEDRDRADPLRDRAGHRRRGLQARRAPPGHDRDRRGGPVHRAAGASPSCSRSCSTCAARSRSA